ncbi:MAG: HNH endonuclease, partial [Actinomyces sp.]
MPPTPEVEAGTTAGEWAERLAGWAAALADLSGSGWSADEVIAAAEALGRLESAVSAAQARLGAAADARGAAGVDGTLVDERVGRRSRREARRRARRARGLAAMPRVADALADGRLTVEHADALVAAAERTDAARVDDELLALVADERVDPARRLIRRWVAAHETRAEAEDRLARQRARRSGRWWTDETDGSTHCHVVLDPVVAAAVTAALEAETDRLWRHDGGRDGTPDAVRTLEQRRADAFSRLVAGVSAHEADPPLTGGGGEAPSLELICTLDVRSLLSPHEAARVEIVDTGPVPASVLDRLEALGPGGVTVRGLLFDGPGRPLWLGRRRRLASGDLRRVLAVRDGGCTECGAPTRHCDAHHLRAWSAGGTTDPDNLKLHCTACHAAAHRHEATGRGDRGGGKRGRG